MPSAASEPLTQKTGRVPLSGQIAEMLIRDIHTGTLPDGERLPPERDMAQKLGIAVGTLRKALAQLEKQGLLSRVQGSGNYINHPLDIDNVYALFRLEKIDGPANPTAQLLSAEKKAKPDEFPLPGKCPHAFRFTRIRRLDASVAALEEIWLDGRFAETINVSFVGDALYRFYREHMDLRITRAEDRVGVALLPDWAPNDFDEHRQSHWGFIERIARGQDGLVAEYSRTWFDPQEVRFVAR
ncbi:MAG: GntR family transcriptional regulator [Granulosicoccus sp.]